MPLTNDLWEWHLTPTGWVLGTEKLNQFVEERATPEDRVLSGRFEETLEDAFSELKLTWEVYWQHCFCRSFYGKSLPVGTGLLSCWKKTR